MIADIKKRAMRRSKIVEGQFKGLIKAIEEEIYCIEALVQELLDLYELSSVRGNK